MQVGKQFCNSTTIKDKLMCVLPKTQPDSAQGNKYPEVIIKVGRNYTKLIGYLKYETEGLPLAIIVGIGCGVFVVVIVFIVIVLCVKRREQMSQQKKLQIQMDNLEGKVAKECKEGE